MTAAQQRFRAVILRLDDSFVVSGATRKGLIATSRRYRDFLTTNEADAVLRPIRALYVPYDDPTPVGSGLVHDGKSWLVRQVTPLRFAGTTVAKVLILTT
jgi:hypothetical protein